MDELQRQHERKREALTVMTDPFQFLDIYLICLVSLNSHAWTLTL